MAPLDILKSDRVIGKVEPVEGKDWAKFSFTVKGQPIKLKGRGCPGKEWRVSQFNSGKLQLYFDVKGDGEMLFVAEHVKKEIQQVLDTECLPDLDVCVSSWIKNNAMYLSWPRQGSGYKPILVNGKQVFHNTDKYDKFAQDLQTIGNADDQVEVGFELYPWAMYGKNKDGTPNNKLNVGISPTLAYINYTVI